MPDKETLQPNTSSTSTQIQVFLASDHLLLLAGIRMLLAAEADLVVMGEAAGGEEVQALNQSLQPDVLLLDLEMSGPPPVETIAYFRQHCPTVRIIVLTNGANHAILREMVAAGVVGYFLKTEPAEKLVQAIRRVARGGLWFSQPILEQLTQKPLAWLPAVEVDDLDLTLEELAVLRLVAAGKSDRQISRELNLSERAVRYRLQSICQKLDVHTRLEAAVRGVRLGLI